MFEDFFENNAPANEVIPDTACVEHIKAAVMERISFDNTESEEKKMKHKFMRLLVIAAAVTAIGAGSLVSANAANNGASADKITKVSSEEWKEVDGSESVLYYTLTDDKADSSDLEAETILKDEWSEVEVYYTLPDGKEESVDLKTELIRSDGWSAVYHTVTDDDEDILFDYIFSLEQNGSSK